jgi:hypothetical protein
MKYYNKPDFKTREGYTPFRTENSMCMIRTPYMLTGFFVQWLRQHFMNPDNIDTEQLKGYTWSDDLKESHITIEPSFIHDDTAVAGRTPAIYVKRNNVQRQHIGMKGGLKTQAMDSEGLYEGRDLTALLGGGHTMFCRGSTEAEAESIGNEVYLNMLLYETAVQKIAKLNLFRVATLGETQKKDGTTEDVWICPVVVTWIYAQDWKLDRNAPILRKIESKFILN